MPKSAIRFWHSFFKAFGSVQALFPKVVIPNELSLNDKCAALIASSDFYFVSDSNEVINLLLFVSQ